jgi:hypothetical protein
MVLILRQSVIHRSVIADAVKQIILAIYLQILALWDDGASRLGAPLTIRCFEGSQHDTGKTLDRWHVPNRG